MLPLRTLRLSKSASKTLKTTSVVSKSSRFTVNSASVRTYCVWSFQKCVLVLFSNLFRVLHPMENMVNNQKIFLLSLRLAMMLQTLLLKPSLMENSSKLGTHLSFQDNHDLNSIFFTHLISLKDYAGKYVYLFFYPLDFTFVCPTGTLYSNIQFLILLFLISKKLLPSVTELRNSEKLDVKLLQFPLTPLFLIWLGLNNQEPKED